MGKNAINAAYLAAALCVLAPDTRADEPPLFDLARTALHEAGLTGPAGTLTEAWYGRPMVDGSRLVCGTVVRRGEPALRTIVVFAVAADAPVVIIVDEARPALAELARRHCARP